MRSIDSLTRRLDNLEKRLPQDDVEYQVYWADEEVPLEPGEKLIVVDFGCILKGDILEDEDEL